MDQIRPAMDQIEEMDIDDDDCVIIDDDNVSLLSKKRAIDETNNNNNNNRTQVKVKDKLPPYESLIRHIVKAKRRVVPDNRRRQLVCVLDTNVLLSHLNQLKQMICLIETKRLPHMSQIKSFMIPWVVVQELDGLKGGNKHNNNNNNNKSVVNVIHFINEQLNKTNGLIKGQIKYNNKSLANQKHSKHQLIEEETNDDKILNYCFELRDKSLSTPTSSPLDVLLITNDVNLCNKALIYGLKVNKWIDFCDKYRLNNNTSFLSDEWRKDNDVVDAYEDNAKDNCESISKRLKSGDNNQVVISGDNKNNNKTNQISRKQNLLHKSQAKHIQSPTKRKTMTATAKSLTSMTSMLKSRMKSIYSNKQQQQQQKQNTVTTNSDCKPLSSPMTQSQSTPPPSVTSSPASSSSSLPLKYDDWIRYRDECEQLILKFIIKTYKQIWGESDWKLMLELDIANTTLRDMIRVIRKEWFGNFSDQFNRNPSVKLLIDRLHTSLNKSYANYSLYFSDLKQFCQLCQQQLQQQQQ